MGRDRRTATIFASVSARNDPQDEIDDALWDELLAEVRKLCGNPRFESINPGVG